MTAAVVVTLQLDKYAAVVETFAAGMPKIRKCFVLAPLGLLSERSLAQEQSAQKIIFHVTAVRSEQANDWCTTGDCSATRITVEGYSDIKGDSTSTEYVLECVEVYRVKPFRLKMACDHVHAHNDYAARLWSTSIAFGETESQSSDEPTLSAYKIISEKEVNRQKR